MTDLQWDFYIRFCQELKSKVAEWTDFAPELFELEKQAAVEAKTPDYPVQTSVVYNRDLDKITKEDEIKLIVIGDNPGKDEQLLKNNRYLVGQAGKIGEGFFKRNPELGVDFRKNVIILNKTPIHSAKTAQLKKIVRAGGKKIADLIEESQIWMAKKTAELQKAIGCELWLVGYSELKGKGLFLKYRDELKKSYEKSEGTFDESWEKVFVFQHFSMNRFIVDLKAFAESAEAEDLSLSQKIHLLGKTHKIEIFS